LERGARKVRQGSGRGGGEKEARKRRATEVAWGGAAAGAGDCGRMVAIEVL